MLQISPGCCENPCGSPEHPQVPLQTPPCCVSASPGDSPAEQTGQGQAEQGCAIGQGNSGCDAPGSAVCSHERAGTSSMQEHAWLPILPKSSRGIQGLQARRVLELDMFIFLRVLLGSVPRGREVFSFPWTTSHQVWMIFLKDFL